MLVLTRGTKAPAKFGRPRSVHVHPECPVILTSYPAGGGRGGEEEINLHHTSTPIMLSSTFAKFGAAALYYAFKVIYQLRLVYNYKL